MCQGQELEAVGRDGVGTGTGAPVLTLMYEARGLL